MAPEHQKDFKVVLKWFLIMFVCTLTLQRDYSGETGHDKGLHFLGWKQIFRSFWSNRQDSWGQYASIDTH